MSTLADQYAALFPGDTTGKLSRAINKIKQLTKTHYKLMPNMNPKTTREHIVSLYGHITGLKKDIASIKKNDLKHIHKDVEKLGGKIDKIYWVLLATVGTVAMSLINTYLM